MELIKNQQRSIAVPGRIDDKQSLGCIRSIRNGAVLIKNGVQVLQYIENRLFNQIAPIQQKLILDLTSEEQSVFKIFRTNLYI